MRFSETMEKTFSAAEAESRIYAKWEEGGCFKAGANASREETFCIMIPPPNVTGSLHMGHAFNNTMQDILIRWRRMQGYDTLWQPGQDHAGIATQMVVERQLAEEGLPPRRGLGREAFLEKIWEWKEKSGGTIINQLKRLGASCDWSRNRFTMDRGFHDAVLKVFVDMYRKGYIYKGKRLVNWDPHFETAISDLEVEQIEIEGNMWYLRYPLENGESYKHVVRDIDGKEISSEPRDYMLVATTRPETMLGDTGVAVHPEDPRYGHLIGKTVRLPLVGRSIPIVADTHADPEKGTGAVKITPAHDFNDWAVGKRCGLEAINVMSENASIRIRGNEEFAKGADPSLLDGLAEGFDGVDRYEARKKIVDLAEEQGWLDRIEKDRHMVPHGDRSQVAIEPFLTDQWFVDTAKIVGPAVEAVKSGKTKILPERDQRVYFHWLENIEPWCISRQLWWGHQIPVWYDDEGNEYCAASEEEARELAGGKPITRDEDVLDTWFSSGLWPIGTLGWPEDTEELRKYFPTDVLVTGFDIIFFWVARMMMMQLAVVDRIPFHTVYVHALVRDEQGQKMSKSIGNVIDPIELIDKFGADAVRFTLTAMAVMGRDLRLSEDRVAGYRNFGTKLWNAARFADMNGCKPDPEFHPKQAKQTVNRWIIGETSRTLEALDQALESYRFNSAANSLYAFVWHKVCDWYVEFSKPLLQSESESVARETRGTMAWVIDQCLVMLHPIMPFITEELWGSVCQRDGMLVCHDWPSYTAQDLLEDDADREMNWVISLIEGIRSARAQMNVPAGARVPLLALDLDSAWSDALGKNGSLVQRLARVEEAQKAEKAPKGSVTIAVEGGTFCIPLADVVDLDKERQRLEKSHAKLEGEINGLAGRLGNREFVEKAPEEVIQTARDRLAAAKGEADRIKGALSSLSEADS